MTKPELEQKLIIKLANVANLQERNTVLSRENTKVFLENVELKDMLHSSHKAIIIMSKKSPY